MKLTPWFWPNSRGERNPMATLTETDVRRVRALAESGVKQSDIARDLGVTQPTVSKILRGGRWGHVTK
jgi:DNA-binding MarR family transcriptional regulator